MKELPVYSPFVTFLFLYGILAVRYVLVSGTLYLGCTWLFSNGQRQVTKNPSIRPKEEAAYSLISCIFFALAGTIMILAFHKGHTLIYINPEQYGYAYLGLSFFLLIFVHETYFYWTHRWMHQPKIFRMVHRVHHLSRHPTAWASFSFHPLEAAIEAAIIPILVFILPVHFTVLGLFLIFMTFFGVVNHLGYELYPKGFARNSFFRWWISATHHQMHHELINCNYGLYFNCWDRWMGTQHPDYESRYEGVFQAPAVASESDSPDFDLLIVGGGLSGGLAAYYLRIVRPELKVLILEKGSQLGSNHTWSFHESDLSALSLEWIKPLISCSWGKQEVRFPHHKRVLETAYHSITSEKFHQELMRSIGDRVLLNSKVESIHEYGVRLANGTLIRSRAVLDARGASEISCQIAYQKFLGLEVELESAHGLEHPVLMDAQVPQKDGFRFIYLLPWSEKKLLIEDTRYSGNPDLNEEEITSEIFAYARAKGWMIKKISRTERGALGIPLTKPQKTETGIGARGFFVHDTTGYSLPMTVRLVEELAKIKDWNNANLSQFFAEARKRNSGQRLFLRALNRMLFWAATPQERYRVLERFYRLPTPTIERFFRAELTAWDCARILIGRPPVPLFKGLMALISRKGIA